MTEIVTTQDVIDGPKQARPAIASWYAGGRQDFPTDRFLNRVREAKLKAAGMMKARRIPAFAMAA